MSLPLVMGIIALLLVNAFFVGAEFAVISARRSSIEPRAQEGSRAARTVLWAMENVSLMLATAQLGITVCSVSLGVVAEPAIAHALAGPFHDWGVSEAWAHGMAVALALFIVVGLHVVVGEMVPKNAAVSAPDAAAMILGPPLVVIARIVKPVIVVLNWSANLLLRMVGVQPRDEVTSAFTADEVHSIVERSEEEGTLSDAAGLLTGAIEFSDRLARDVMTPLAQVQTVPQGVSAEGLEAVAARTGYSRFPVERDGEVVGYLHIKDVLFVRPGDREEPLPAWRVREMAKVRADAEIENVLGDMRSSGSHVALVLDGDAVVGVVFLEDIIEELVGEVRDSIARGHSRS